MINRITITYKNNEQKRNPNSKSTLSLYGVGNYKVQPVSITSRMELMTEQCTFSY